MKIANFIQNIERLDAEKAEVMEKISALENEEASKQSRLKYLKSSSMNTAPAGGYEKQMEELLKTLMKKRRT